MIGSLWIMGLWVVATGQAAQPPPSPTGQPAEQEVGLESLPAASVVVLDHRGPYWRMGGPLQQVAEFMAKTGQPGPMFARYLDDPGEVAPEDLRAEVGLFVTGDVAVGEPFRRVEWPAGRVAALSVPGHFGRAAAAWDRVFNWIKSAGHRPRGYVTEVYRQDADAGAPGDRVTEIRVWLADEGSADGQPQPQTSAEPAAAPPAGGASPADNPERGQTPDTAREGQLAVRLNAIRKAVAASYPDQAPVVEAYLEPLLADVGASGAQANAGRAVAAATDPATVPESARTEVRGSIVPAMAGSAGREVRGLDAALLSELDALLVNIVLGVLEPAELLEQVAAITGRVSDAMDD